MRVGKEDGETTSLPEHSDRSLHGAMDRRSAFDIGISAISGCWSSVRAIYLPNESTITTILSAGTGTARSA